MQVMQEAVRNDEAYIADIGRNYQKERTKLIEEQNR